MDSVTLEKKTLDELRELARHAGLRGYSGLRKKQLIEVLLKQEARPSALHESRPTATKPEKPASARRETATPFVSHTGSRDVAAPARTAEDAATTEQHIESAKFEVTPPGVRYIEPVSISDLHEDIDHLPAPGESVLCLLPQKPGVVHAYWALQSGAPVKELRLRLCRMSGDAVELLDEVRITGERGHWYFHAPETEEPGNFVAQLGTYDSAGNFVTAIKRGIARIPSLYASMATDRRWWIDDDEFRAMYMRAGGVTQGAKLLWPGAESSRHR